MGTRTSMRVVIFTALSFLLLESVYSQDCAITCQTDYNPVCGSDGNTYANECVMKVESCVQKKVITVASNGECPDVSANCNKICPTIYKPVCGSDDKTYANECVLKSEACTQKKSITVARQGACKAQCGKAIDLVFAHDASGSLKETGFQKIKDFTNELIDDFDISVQKTHVGVVVFSYVAKVAIRLDETFDKDVLKSKVQNISYSGYTTATDAALRVANDEMFSLKGGVRQNVPLVLIVLTDGKCTACTENVTAPARKLKAKGVNIFAIAVGQKVNVPELLSMVSEPESEHLLQVASTDKLKTLIKKLSTKGCAAKAGKCPAPPSDVTCPEGIENGCYGDAMCDGPEKCCFDGCSSNCVHPLLNCLTPVEIAFALDSSSSIRTESYRRMKDVTKRVVDSFSVSQNNTRFSILLYSSDAELQFNLVRYDSASGIKTAIDNLPHMKSGTRIDKALRLAKEKIFSLSGYVRQRRPMVLVVVTDGSTNRGSEDLAVASQPLKDYGVTVIAVGVGPEVNRYELVKFASQPTSENIFTSKNFRDLIPSIFALTSKICREKPGTCPVLKASDNCVTKEDECKNDFECYGTSKCCSDGCRKTCRGQLDTCRRKVDLTFVIDQSDSVGATNFETIKQFVARTIDHFKVGPSDTHVSVICFGTTANVEWTFRDYPGQNIKAAKDSLQALRFSGGASRLDLSMDLANERIYNTAYGMRENVFKLMVIITDGGFGALSAMRKSVKALKGKGVNFVALGVGQIQELPALQTITQYAEDNNRVLLVKRFDFLKQYAQDIADVACFAPGTVVPSGKLEKGTKENKKCGPPKCLKGPKGSRGRQGRPGTQGQTGPDGDSGKQGPQGPKGASGDPGLQGQRGPRGDEGMQGLPGHPGINGIPGIPGVEGRPGNPGQCGLKGSVGDKGPEGVDGLPGSAGNPGEVGPRGPKGEPSKDIFNTVPLIKGAKGNVGDPGFEGPRGQSGQGGLSGRKGPRGDVGDAGEDGLPGEKGDPGKVLRKIKGDKGEPGLPGASGSKGVPQVAGGNAPYEGPDGYRGLKGEPGIKGVPGETVNVLGEKGARGPAGPRGSVGERGSSGAQGPKGLPGFPGLVGDGGAAGTQGPRGRDGPAGSSGLNGAKGAVGLPGDTGEDALEARKGDTGKRGDVGFKGPEGSQGPAGDRGIRGPKGKIGMIVPGKLGDIGDQGNPGPRGDPGLSGVTGMEGSEGPAGAVGDPGPPGDSGQNARRIDGVDGMMGSPGRKGAKGPMGDPGPPGSKGSTTVVKTLCREGTCPKGLPGDTGPPGNTGPPGDIGATGLPGFKGYQQQCPTCPPGEQGSVGDYGLPGTPGTEGLAGPAGLQGDDGADGLQGPQGSVGLPGLQGEDGLAGTRGSQGQKGEPADQPASIRGDRGSTGAKGLPGRRGERGPIGPEGLQGYKGEKGIAGITPQRAERGIPGERGKNAKKGAKGLTGEPGDSVAGERGAKGQVGDRGESGPLGPRGDDGAKGQKGGGPTKAAQLQKGAKGFPGEMGEDGDPGTSPQGQRGATGDQGQKGEPGRNAVIRGGQGPTGPQGQTGSVGPKGEIGDSPAGNPGPTGEKGALGPRGPKGEQGPTGQKGRAECGSLQDPTDVAFLLDASASLREANFKKEKFFVKKIIKDIFPVSPDGNRIGIIQYSTTAKVEVHFDDYFVNTSLIAAIDDIPYLNGQSRIDLGLKLARDDLFKTSKGARQGVRKVLVLITDGYQSRAVDMVSPIVLAKDLKDQGVTIFVIGAGVEIDWNLLKQVASTEQYVLEAENFDLLQNRVGDIQSALKVGCLITKGQKGAVGFQGDAGKDGKKGSKGRKGMVGTSFGGDGGERGQKGVKGDQGVGIQGSPGSQGLMGFPGSQGSRGDDGAAGLTGRKGLKGRTGPPAEGPAPFGPKGYPGPAGPKGKSGEKLCREVLRTDLAFFLDSSASVGFDNFQKTKSFIETIVKAFDVSPTNTHVSVSTYELETKIEFDFLRYTSPKTLFEAIKNIGYRRGKATYIDSALISADQQVFTAQNNARPTAFKAVILITDGQQSTRPPGEKSEDLAVLAQKLRDKGVRVYVIGIGAEVDQLQLRSMVDVPHHLFLRKDFDSLTERIEEELVELNDLGCRGEKGDKGRIGPKGFNGLQGIAGPEGKKGGRGDPGLKGGPGNPGPPSSFSSSGRKGDKGSLGVEGLPGLPGCVPTEANDKPLDLAFLMDASGSLYYDNYDKEKEFVKRVISLQNIGKGLTHVSVMSYSQNATVHVGFRDYYDRESASEAVSAIPYEALNTRIDRALLLAKSKAFSESNGARPYARRVAILLTDGQQSVVPGSMDVARAAKLLRDEDVEIFAVGIGPEIDLMQLGEMVSKPSLVFFAADFDRLLREISREVNLALRCRGGPAGPPGDRGVIGRAGPAGKKGDRGDQGSSAVIGTTGRTGLQGDDGPLGPPGPKGAKGIVGDTGDQGFEGLEGGVGSQGERGDAGSLGAQGDTGPQGSRGPKGFRGIKGINGEIPKNIIPGPGPKGEKGFKGFAGVNGFPGFPGDPDSMPQNLLDSVRRGQKGDIGDAGPAGPPGENGTFLYPPGPLTQTGDKGNRGPQGQEGLRGEIGLAGPNGNKGEKGESGPPGLPGLGGPVGDAGPQGFDGPQGRAGSSNKGLPGGPGFIGFPGPKGNKGSSGLPGFMGLNGAKGAPGAKGPKGFPANPQGGIQGPKGERGSVGRAGPRGPKGLKGETLPGEKGAVGDEGPVGSKGVMGAQGPRGPKGFKGFWGIEGIRGPDGEDGNPGSEGPMGIKGDMGEITFNGENKGDQGDIGSIGRQGARGDTGPRGPIGPVGLPGSKGKKGDRGKDGLPGLPGIRGPDGEIGPTGFQGYQGPKGPGGDEGLPGPTSVADGFYIVRHSQTDRVPSCPKGYKKLWDGYSWVYSVGNGMAHGQDLANAGSCARSFNTMPFLYCENNQKCAYSSRNDYMYWLSARNTMLMSPVTVSAVSPFISRCAVCETPAVHLAVHSQDTSQPDCPFGWSSLWSGYSFLMMTGSGGTGTGESLTSSGSCLEDFRPNPFIECQGARGTCNFFSDKFSFWLTTVDSQTQFQAQPSETLHGDKGHDLKSKISRCRVCTKSSNINELSGPSAKNSTSAGSIISRH